MSSGGPERAALALGANLGPRERTLEAALREIAALPATRLVARSSWHETAPVGGPPDQPRYLNGAALVESGLEPEELLDALHAIERRHGRARESEPRNAPRTLDIDLLLMGQHRASGAGLELPHPSLEQREFVLAPLAEIAPELALPSGRSVRQALDALRRARVRAGRNESRGGA